MGCLECPAQLPRFRVQGHIERLSFARLRPNARLRDELLNGEIFYSLEEVRCVTG